MFTFAGPAAQLQEQAFVSHIVSEGPVITRRTVNHSYQLLPGTSVRYLKPAESGSGTAVQQYAVHQHQPTGRYHSHSTLTRRRTGGQSQAIAADKSIDMLPTSEKSDEKMIGGVTTNVQYFKSGDEAAAQKSGPWLNTSQALTGVTQVGYVTTGNVEMPLDQSRLGFTKSGLEPLSSSGDVTVIKKVITESPVHGGDTATTTRTVRRSYHQVETLEGLKTEDLNREMERMSQEVLPGNVTTHWFLHVSSHLINSF